MPDQTALNGEIDRDEEIGIKVLNFMSSKELSLGCTPSK